MYLRAKVLEGWRYPGEEKARKGQKYSRSKKLPGGPACSCIVMKITGQYLWVCGWKPEFPEENHPYCCERVREGDRHVQLTNT